LADLVAQQEYFLSNVQNKIQGSRRYYLKVKQLTFPEGLPPDFPGSGTSLLRVPYSQKVT